MATGYRSHEATLVISFLQIIIYMDALPKNPAGKILRIKLADRLKLKDVDEEVRIDCILQL